MPVACTSDTVKLVEPPAERFEFEIPMMPAWKAPPVPLPICTFVVVVFATTRTPTVDCSVPAVAVTLIVRNELSPAVTKRRDRGARSVRGRGRA